MLGILLFVGFEAAASIGEESHDPHRSIPRALIGTVAVSAIFFVLMSYAISIGFGKAAVDQGAGSTRPRSTTWRPSTSAPGTRRSSTRRHPRRHGPRARDLRDARPRLLRPGRDGLLPSVFAKTSSHDTPWVGNLIVIVGCVGLMLLVKTAKYFAQFVIPVRTATRSRCSRTEFATFIMAATVGSFAVELVYLIVAVVALGMVSRRAASGGSTRSS